MFNKTAETEKVEVLDEKGRIARVFKRLNKSEATELEILRAAKEIGISVEGLHKHCTVSGSMLTFKG